MVARSVQAVSRGSQGQAGKSKRNYGFRYLFGLVWMAAVLAYAAQEGLVGVAAVGFLFVAFPVIAWYLVRRLRTQQAIAALQ